jgi:hypothetical protein
VPSATWDRHGDEVEAEVVEIDLREPLVDAEPAEFDQVIDTAPARIDRQPSDLPGANGPIDLQQSTM